MTRVEFVTLAAMLVALIAALVKLRRNRSRPASPLARWWPDRRPTPPNPNDVPPE
jgi:hypothetical protein